MKVSYSQLISEHDAIEHAASALLADLDGKEIGGASLSAQLDELARVVEDHIDVEEGVVTRFEPDRLSGPWVAAWADGLAAFDHLKADWLAFLNQWDRAAIERDRQSFRQAADAILGRLRERVQLETQAFYATALQVGAIELR